MLALLGSRVTITTVTEILVLLGILLFLLALLGISLWAARHMRNNR